MDVDIGMAVAFTAGVLLGGAGGVLVICILVGGKMRRGKHERVQNVVYRKKDYLRIWIKRMTKP